MVEAVSFWSVRDEPQELDSDNHGKGEVGHSLYDDVVPNRHLRQMLLPTVAPHGCHKKSHCNRNLKGNRKEAPKLGEHPVNFFALGALGD